MQEETDTMIIQQVADVRPKKHSLLQMTQMLLHCLVSFAEKKTDFNFNFGFNHSVLDIKATVNQHHDATLNLLAANGLTGYDTVAPYFGIGKSMTLNLFIYCSQSAFCIETYNTQNTCKGQV